MYNDFISQDLERKRNAYQSQEKEICKGAIMTDKSIKSTANKLAKVFIADEDEYVDAQMQLYITLPLNDFLKIDYISQEYYKHSEKGLSREIAKKNTARILQTNYSR